MSDTERPEWLIEPATFTRWQVSVAVGQNAELSPAVRSAIDHLMATLQEDDLTTFEAGPGGCPVACLAMCQILFIAADSETAPSS
jgi:hypothetical protein